MSLMNSLKLFLQDKKWRARNKHNSTSTLNLFNIEHVKVGKGTYGGLYVLTHGLDANLSIGNYCSIGPQVAFILQSDHPLNHVSTYPFKVMAGLLPYEAITKGDIVIEDDVWIGFRTIVLSGVHIGRGAVIGAGSIITKDIPPYSIVVGAPGKVIGSRFDKETIDLLKDIDMSRINGDDVPKLEDVLYRDINDTSDAMYVSEIINKVTSEAKI